MIRTKIKSKSPEQARIDRALTKRKKWLIENEPDCIFCNNYVGRFGQLAHKVRRSWASRLRIRFEIQTMPLNTGLAHPSCHEIFDNNKEGAKLLPNYDKILEDIKEIDIEYYRITFNE